MLTGSHPMYQTVGMHNTLTAMQSDVVAELGPMVASLLVFVCFIIVSILSADPPGAL